MIKKMFAREILLAALAVCLAAGVASAKVVAVSGEGWREDVNGVRVVHLSGTPREMGLQHGTLLKEEIKALMAYFYEEKKNIFGADEDTLARGARVIEKNIPAEYMEEMRGIAEGAGVDFNRILYTNTFLDVVSAGWMGVKPPGCSNFAAFPGITKNKELLHGRNLDWSSEKAVSAANTVFFYTPKDGGAFASLSWPGMVGTLTGLNAEKMSMGEMTSISSEATLDGMPIMMMLREVLENSKTLEDAFKILSETKRTTGYNVLVTDAKSNDGFVAEITAKRIVRFAPEEGYLMHTNHFVDAGMKKNQTKYFFMYDNGSKSDTFYRYQRLTELLKSNTGNIDAALAESFLGDKYDMGEKKFSDKLDNSVCKGSTLQSVVMVPAKGELYVALKSIPAPLGDYVKLTFTPGEKAPKE